MCNRLISESGFYSACGILHLHIFALQIFNAELHVHVSTYLTVSNSLITNYFK